LLEIASRQEWFEAANLTTTAPDVTNLQELLDSLCIEPDWHLNYSNAAQNAVEQETVVLLGLRKSFSAYHQSIPKYKCNAVDLASLILLNIKLQMRASNPQNTELYHCIAQLAKTFDKHSRTT
jgi:hypothetical protein